MGEALSLAAALGLTGVVLVQQAVDWRYHRFPERDHYAQSSYGDLFAELAARGVTGLVVVDPGSTHLGRPGYAPLLMWHQRVWRERGLFVRRMLAVTPGLDEPVASCQPAVIAAWSGWPSERIGSCAVLWRVPVKQFAPAQAH